jgi:hypothetical protein
MLFAEKIWPDEHQPSMEEEAMSLVLEAGHVPLDTATDGVVQAHTRRVMHNTIVTVINQDATSAQVEQRYLAVARPTVTQ